MLRTKEELHVGGDHGGDSFDEIQKLQKVEEALKSALTERVQAAVEQIDAVQQAAAQEQLSDDELNKLSC